MKSLLDIKAHFRIRRAIFASTFNMQKATIFGASIYNSFKGFNSYFLYILFYLLCLQYWLLQLDIEKINDHRQRVNRIDWNSFQRSGGNDI